ncbi:ComE operon protein 1 [subsurface metagenome]
MTASRQINYWTVSVILLVAIIAIGSIVIWLRSGRSQPIEITIAPEPELTGEIYVGGGVNNPGFYPLTAGDSLADIIQAAGGTTDSADLSQLQLHITNTGEAAPPAKVNLNMAEAWLLEALPGIGPSRAQAIIDYRQQNGRLNGITELLQVEGIGAATYEKIKHLITVAD